MTHTSIMTPQGPAKPCSKCGVMKLHTEYRRRSDRPGNVHACCKACDSIRQRDYARRHPDRLRAWRAANREHYRKWRREYERERRKKQRESLEAVRRMLYETYSDEESSPDTRRSVFVGADAALGTGGIEGGPGAVSGPGGVECSGVDGAGLGAWASP